MSKYVRFDQAAAGQECVVPKSTISLAELDADPRVADYKVNHAELKRLRSLSPLELIRECMKDKIADDPRVIALMDRVLPGYVKFLDEAPERKREIFDAGFAKPVAETAAPPRRVCQTCSDRAGFPVIHEGRQLVHSAYEMFLSRIAKYNDPYNEEWDWDDVADKWARHAYAAFRDLLAVSVSAQAVRTDTVSVSQWQPIESAPKDGTDVVLFWPGYGNGVTVGFYLDNSNTAHPWAGWSVHSGQLARYGQPTCWQPLPAPPERKSES